MGGYESAVSEPVSTVEMVVGAAMAPRASTVMAKTCEREQGIFNSEMLVFQMKA